MKIIKITKEQFDNDLNLATVPGLEHLDGDAGMLIGKGEGVNLMLNENGEIEYQDFGTCGWCGQGRYIGEPGSLWGTCDYCGAT